MSSDTVRTVLCSRCHLSTRAEELSNVGWCGACMHANRRFVMDYPSSAEVNAMDARTRRYIHDLETRCDPAGELQERAALKMQVDGLESENARLIKMLEISAALTTDIQTAFNKMVESLEKEGYK